MNAHQLERAAYIAAHAILAANMTAPELACPGAKRSHTVDTIADIIKGVFELHCTELDALGDWRDRPIVHRGEKILPFRAETAVQQGS